MSHRLTALLAAGGMALVATPFAVAAGEGRPLSGGERNPFADQRKAFAKETEIIADNPTYGTRQSNKSANGGGAIYGCRSGDGGSPKQNEPCVRANNLSTGFAFEFETDGKVGGTIDTEGGDTARPFTTNATGVATGLNADRVDSKSAEDLTKDAVAAAQAAEPFVSVAANGDAGAKRGVAKVTKGATPGVYTVDFERDVSNCAQQATVRGADAAFVTVNQDDPADKDTVTVRTFDAATPANGEDTAFHLSLTC